VPALYLFRRVLFGGETFVDRDLEAYHRAGKAILVRLLAESPGLPMWNPYLASGQPFAANPASQLFHPLTWLFAALPFEWAFRLQVIVPVLLSGVAMAFLLLTLGRSRAAATLGALAWAYGGYLLSVANLLPTLLGVSAVPVLVAFLVRVARSPTRANAAGLGLSLGALLLAGEAMLLAVGLAAPAALLCGAVGPGAMGARPRATPAIHERAAALAGGLALGLAIGAATLLPGALLFRKTVRAEGLPAETALLWSMPPERLAELVVPNALGHANAPRFDAYWGRSRYPSEGSPFVYSIYPGLLVTAAAAAAWARRRTVEHAWAAVALLGWALCVGGNTPLWPLVRETVPFAAGFRFPEKLVFLVVLGVTVSASAGFDLLLRRRRGARIAAGSVLGLASLAGLAAATGLLDVPSFYLGPGVASRDVLEGLARRDGAALLATGAASLAALLVLARKSRFAGTVLLTLVLGADVTLRGSTSLRSEPAVGVDAAPSWVREILAKGDPRGRVFHVGQWQFRHASVWGYLTPPPMPAFWGLKLTFENDLDHTELAWSRRATEAARSAVERQPTLLPPLLERRGVTSIVRLHDATRVTPEGVVAPPGLDSPLDVDFYVEPARPAFLVDELRVAQDAEAWLRELRALGDAAGRAAIVDAAGPALPTPPGRGDVVRYSTRPGRIEADLRCDGPQPCFLALTETWDEHWRATVDGKPAAIRRSDLSLMGLPVPTGTHAVVLEYDDPSVRLGASLTGAGGLVGLLLAATGFRRRPSRARPPAASPDAEAPSPPPAAPRPAPGAKAARRRPKR